MSYRAYQSRSQKILNLLGPPAPKKAKRKLEFSDFHNFDRSGSVCSSPALSIDPEEKAYLNEILNEVENEISNECKKSSARPRGGKVQDVMKTQTEPSNNVNLVQNALIVGNESQRKEFENKKDESSTTQNLLMDVRPIKEWDTAVTSENSSNQLTSGNESQQKGIEKEGDESSTAQNFLKDIQLTRESNTAVTSENCTNLKSPLRPQLVAYSDSESASEKTPVKEDKRRKTRKRKKDPKKWKINVRKDNREKGLSYINRKGKFVPKKEMKDRCKENCFYKCKLAITDEERKQLFNDYYSLSAEGKKSFILANTVVHRVKIEGNKKQKRDQFFRYYLPSKNEQIRVCKKMFLGTLSISEKVVRLTQKKRISELVPAEDMRKNSAKPKISEEARNIIRRHINRFPAVESHYCRMDTSKKYLCSNLNIAKMYKDYVNTICKEEDVEPCKESFYREIFNTEFNIDFLKPKKDKCDKCEAYKLAVKEKRVTPEMEMEYKLHYSNKLLMRQERNEDRAIKKTDTVVVCIDLQNVINLPHTDVGTAFYKRKLSIYNLTGHAVQRQEDGTKKKKAYCCIWNDALCGRSGNDMASGFYKILSKVANDFDGVKNIITWADSCVPQNRNQMISFAAGQFLQDHPQIQTLVFKYSSPGHSGLQEVDNIHSQIEKAMRLVEIWSPVGLIRLLLKVNTRNPFQVIQMQKEDFKDFHSLSGSLNYNQVPYFKVKQLCFYQNRRNMIFYKLKHKQNEMTGVTLCPTYSQKSKEEKLQIYPPTIKNCPVSTRKIVLSKLKMEDIESLFPIMPYPDQQYYVNTFKIHRKKTAKCSTSIQIFT